MATKQTRPTVAVVLGGSGERLESEVIRYLSALNLADFTEARTLMPNNLVDRSAFLDCLVKSSFAIVGAGTMLWECCAMGVPTLALSVAPNQHSQVRWAADYGACLSADFNNRSDIGVLFASLCEQIELRSSLSIRGRSLVDGLGVDRVVHFLEEKFGGP